MVNPTSAAVAVVIPCHNEELTVGKVVEDFRAALPEARILVVDNRSRDRTSEIARAAGADVISERRPGKGFALLTGFREAHEGGAEYLIMVDGDDTYPAADAPKLLAAAEAGAEMVIGTRLQEFEAGAFRAGHSFGNWLFIFLVRLLFGVRTQDLFSGYRVITRRFLESTPLIAQGFEVEAELSLQATVQQFPVAEVQVRYRARPKENPSKLHTYRDGYRILMAILTFFRDYKPLTFFGLLATFFLVLSLAGGGVVIAEFVQTGLVPRLPLAVLSAALFILAALCLTCGVIISTINRRSAEIASLIPWK
ncbi:MAG TPA: glycosyltransferase family 2 protein [Thermoanaerobaculia bacterium]|jgi:glycosyltransferase involved in cell wall biosynthesis|nr:glycosyltransferase family 2 protein [Thermoanaerobaculia bacterium]